MSSSSARISVSGAGGSMKSKCTRSSMPSFFSCSTTEPRFDRRISGYVLSCHVRLIIASSLHQTFSFSLEGFFPELISFSHFEIVTKGSLEEN